MVLMVVMRPGQPQLPDLGVRFCWGCCTLTVYRLKTLQGSWYTMQVVPYNALDHACNCCSCSCKPPVTRRERHQAYVGACTCMHVV